MTTDDNQANGDRTPAQPSQGSIGQASGPIAQNFGQQTNIDTGGGDNITTGGGDYVGGDKVAGDKVMGDKNIIVQPPLPPALYQLRAPVGDFVGREQEIAQLIQALCTAGRAAAAISGVRGMGGIGKTELAYTVAARLAAQFPDAQLLVELRGASNSPLTAEQALQTVIRAFEREAELPDDLGQLKGIYSSVLNGKRALILADDAKDATQIRPLLPPLGCALLVTSRNRFSLPGMAALDLGALPPADAEVLLLEICPRIGAHAEELARLCGYLPLALRMSAGLLATNDSRGVARYLEQLQAERLKHLSDPDDPQASVEASLQVSYDALKEHARAALCQLSVFPTSFDLAATQAVVASERDVADVLELLRRRSLLEWDASLERYNLHDLVRAFAAARLEDADAVRLRHARYYAGIASHAEYGLYLKGAVLAGLALFDQERIHIDAGWNWALGRARDPTADALLREYTQATISIGALRYNTQHERIPRLEAALAVARRQGDPRAECTCLGSLGTAYAYLGDHRRAIGYHERSLVIAGEIGDRYAEENALGNLGNEYADLSDPSLAIAYYERSLAIAREIGDQRGEGNALSSLGAAYAVLGDPSLAITYHEQSLAIARAIGDQRAEGRVLGSLGMAYAYLGDSRRAIAHQELYLAIARSIGDRRAEGNALNNLGNDYAILGDSHHAIEYYEQRLAIVRNIGDRQGEAETSWNLGEELANQGNLAQAVALLQVCVDYEREIGHPDAEKDAAQLGQLRQRLAASQNPPEQNDDE